MEASITETEGIDVQVTIPTVMKSTPDVFAEYYEHCVERKAVLLVTLQFVTWGKCGATLAIAEADEGDEALVDLEMVLDDSFPRQQQGQLAIWILSPQVFRKNMNSSMSEILNQPIPELIRYFYVFYMYTVQ